MEYRSRRGKVRRIPAGLLGVERMGTNHRVGTDYLPLLYRLGGYAGVEVVCQNLWNVAGFWVIDFLCDCAFAVVQFCDIYVYRLCMLTAAFAFSASLWLSVKALWQEVTAK